MHISLDGSAETPPESPTTLFLIMPAINFTKAELETISVALDDYIHYDDPDADPEDLIGGISVADRCASIQSNIAQFFATK
jgi:hypothetical protein